MARASSCQVPTPTRPLPQDIDINLCTPGTRVALRSDSYQLHRILPTRVDPLVSLMKVEKVRAAAAAAAAARGPGLPACRPLDRAPAAGPGRELRHGRRPRQAAAGA